MIFPVSPFQFFTKLFAQISLFPLINLKNCIVMQRLWQFLKNASIQFRKSRKGRCWEFHLEELWEMKWDLLKHMGRRNTLVQEYWWRNSWHLGKCMKFLAGPKFDLMVTYLEDSQVPRF